MANTCISLFRIKGSKEELEALVAIMRMFDVNNLYSRRWVGHLIEFLNNGEIPEDMYTRANWYDLEVYDDYIEFGQESAWEPCHEAWDWIASRFKTLQVYFSGEEPECEVFLKRSNNERGWFMHKYDVDMFNPSDREYYYEDFNDLESAIKYINNITGECVKSEEDVNRLCEKWQEQDEDCYIHIHEYNEVY